MRSQINILQTQLQESETERENYHNALNAAENRFERSKSDIVRTLESRGGAQGKEDKEEERRPSPAVSGLVNWLIGGRFDRKFCSFLIFVQVSPLATAPPTQLNGFHGGSEIEALQGQLKARESQIVELEKEAALCRDQKTMLELEVSFFFHLEFHGI